MKSQDRLHCEHAIRIALVSVAVIGFDLIQNQCQAGEKEDLNAARSIISLVVEEDATLRNQADRFYSQISNESHLKPLVTQAMSLVCIRQRRYLDALKCLSYASKPSADSPNLLELGRDRLKLWLLLEVESEEAESQFKVLVKQAINKALKDPDRAETCAFLGKVIGMLESSESQSIVAREILQKGRTALEKIESKSAVSKHREGLGVANEWSTELNARVKEFERVGTPQSDSIDQSSHEYVKRAERDLLELKSRLRDETQEKESLENEGKELFKYLKVCKVQWNTETPGKPSIPREPVRPKEPKTTYKINPKTGLREVDQKPSANDLREYDRKNKEYEERLQKYPTEVRTFPDRLAAWKQADNERRTLLQVELQTVQKNIDRNKQATHDKQDAIASGVLNELKHKTKEAEMLKQAAKISSIALAHLKSNASQAKMKSHLRPSNFQLLDYQWEVARLQKNLRESK